MRSVLLAEAAAILPLAALSLAPSAATATTIAPFVPGSEPMVLTRVLRRPLPGGIEISTARSYEIRFIREDQGYRIEGKLIGVTVEAPRQFEALAALERSRPDADMFPMRIDSSGRFMASGSQQAQAVAPEVARIAQGLVPASLAPAEARDASAFIGQSTATRSGPLGRTTCSGPNQANAAAARSSPFPAARPARLRSPSMRTSIRSPDW